MRFAGPVGAYLRWTSAVLLLAHLLACVAVLSYFAPQVEGRVQALRGIASPYKVCGRTCDTGIYVDNTLLECWVSWFGPRFSCPEAIRRGQPAQATYFVMPTLMSHVGLAAPSRVALSFQQDGQFLVSKSADDIRRIYYRGAWLLYFVFGLSFVIVNKFDYDRRRTRNGQSLS